MEASKSIIFVNISLSCSEEMVFRRRLTPELRAYVRLLRTESDKTVRQIADLCEISPSSVIRITRESFNKDSKKLPRIKTGRPRKLCARTERKIVRTLKMLRRTRGNFTAKDIMVECGMTEEDISVRSVQRFLNQQGYRFLQARKKGLMKRTDLRQRVTFARDIRKHHGRNFWKQDVMFYFDGTGFAHKVHPQEQATAPRGRIWRKSSEGLALDCTAKGMKVGTGGRVLRLFVAISYGKGVVLVKPYSKLGGRKFARFVRRYFPRTMEACGAQRRRLFLQDGDPSQNSSDAKAAFSDIGLEVLRIPPRSPDLNPIENVFNIVGRQLQRNALRNNIKAETFPAFQKRVIRTLKTTSIETIDNIIASMSKRLDLIIATGGRRLKY